MDIDVGGDLNSIDRKQKPRREVTKPSVGNNHQQQIEKNIIRVCCLRELIKFSRPMPPEWALCTKKNHEKQHKHH